MPSAFVKDIAKSVPKLIRANIAQQSVTNVTNGVTEMAHTPLFYSFSLLLLYFYFFYSFTFLLFYFFITFAEVWRHLGN